MDDGTVTVKLILDTSKYTSAARKAAEQLERIAEQATAADRGLDRFNSSLQVATREFRKLGEETRSFNRGLKVAGDRFDSLSGDAAAANTKLNLTSRELREVSEDARVTNRSLDRVADELREVGTGAATANRGLEGTTRELKDVSRQAARADAALSRTQSATRNAGAQAGTAGGRFGAAAVSVKALAGGFAGLAVAAGAAVAVRKVGEFAVSSVGAFTDLNEAINATNVIYGDAASIITDFGETAAESAGLSNAAFQGLAAKTGSLLQNFGFTAEEAARETLVLTERAADLASVHNIEVADALDKTNAALRGETEPIRALAVSLDAASVSSRAVALGLAESTTEVSKHAKAQATLSIIYGQTDAVAGDFANTSGDAANRQRILSAEYENTKAVVGKSLLPAYEAILGIAENALPSIEGFGLALGDLATALIPFFTDFGAGLGEVTDRYITPFITAVSKTISAFEVLFGSDTAGDAYNVTVAFDELRRSIRDGQQPAAAFAESLFFLAEKGSLTADRLVDLGDGVEFVGQEHGVAIAEVLELARATGVEADQVALLEDGLYAQITALGLTGTEVRNLTNKYGLIDAEQRAAAAAAEELAAATDEVAEVTEEAVSVAEEAREEYDRYSTALRTAAEEQRGLVEVTKTFADPAAKAASEIDKLNTANAKLAELQGKSESTARELAEAELDVAIQTAVTQAALDAFDGSGLEAGVQAIADLLGSSDDKARELLGTLGVLDGTTVAAEVVTVFKSRGPRAVGGRNEVFSSPRGIRGLERGGATRAGELVRVGERGPELFQADTPGRIIPNGQVAGTLGSMGATSTVTNNYNVTVEVEGPLTVEEGTRRVLAEAALVTAAN